MEPSRSFTHAGRRIAYRSFGEGPRIVVLIHGLLMDSRMYTKLTPTLVEAGNRVVLVDMIGHGDSDHPHDMTAHSMTQYGRDVIALLDHLGVEQAVIGGTSLGANVTLEAAVHAPHRVRGMFLEMPVLEHGIVAAAAAFVPLGLAIRLSKPTMRAISWVTRKIPRTHWLLDVAIDFVRRDPISSLAVLDGLTFGRIAPPGDERKKLTMPALVVGHTRDPIHPFSDADCTARELGGARIVQASSIYEWRLWPERLDDELVRFLDGVWATGAALRAV